MSEYHYVLSLYQKHKSYEKKVVIVSLLLLVLATGVVRLDLIRVSPLIIYALAMMGAPYGHELRVATMTSLYCFWKNMSRKYLKIRT
ncbi:hypothetical protein [Enterococcus sp.]|uniref:hypothetical protein n=1 Tax=Enterococcus sp. TaxID=35783 RepID=UPI002FC6FA80